MEIKARTDLHKEELSQIILDLIELKWQTSWRHRWVIVWKKCQVFIRTQINKMTWAWWTFRTWLITVRAWVRLTIHQECLWKDKKHSECLHTFQTKTMRASSSISSSKRLHLIWCLCKISEGLQCSLMLHIEISLTASRSYLNMPGNIRVASMMS